MNMLTKFAYLHTYLPNLLTSARIWGFTFWVNVNVNASADGQFKKVHQIV